MTCSAVPRLILGIVTVVLTLSRPTAIAAATSDLHLHLRSTPKDAAPAKLTETTWDPKV